MENGGSGRKLAIALLLVPCLAATAFAQSSGNFTASYDKTQCAISDSDGTLSGGISGAKLPDVTIKVSAGGGVALVMTPALVTGLFSRHRVNSSSSSSTQNVGLRVKVAVDGSTATVVPELGRDGGIYDQRFSRASADFLPGLTTCIDDCFTLAQRSPAAP